MISKYNEYRKKWCLVSYNFINEKEASFLKHSEDYLRAVQERVAAFFVSTDHLDVRDRVNEASDLWYNIVVDEASSFYKLLYQKGFKSEDNNFMKRKGYRTKNEFAFDLITNWAFERTIVPYLHEFSGLNCEPFRLNPETCDTDAKLGWEAGINEDKPRKINSKYDFITDIDGEIHNIELKSMFVHDRRSANFKVFFTPEKGEDLNKYHVLFFHFNGLGNPKEMAPFITTFKLFYIPWTKLIKCHIHYPPQLDGKPCYLVHFNGAEACEIYDANGRKTTSKIANNNSCFELDKALVKKIIRYDELSPYLNYKDEKFHPENILKIIKRG